MLGDDDFAVVSYWDQRYSEAKSGHSSPEFEWVAGCDEVLEAGLNLVCTFQVYMM